MEERLNAFEEFLKGYSNFGPASTAIAAKAFDLGIDANMAGHGICRRFPKLSVAKIQAKLEKDYRIRAQHFKFGEGDFVPPGKLAGGLTYQSFDKIKDRAIEWLWPNRLAVGKMNLICGFAEKGKSQITINIAATVSNGGEWPDKSGNAEEGAVIIVSAEDDDGDTIKPRLKFAGANVANVLTIPSVVTIRDKNGRRARVLNIYEDLDRLAITIENIRRDGKIVRAIIFDPLNAYFGTKDNKTDSFKTSDMRAVLTPLKEWAAKNRVAIIGITHFNKDQKGTNLLHRIVDSQAITAATRTVWACLDRDVDGVKQLVFARGKNNIGPADTKALIYEIEGGEIDLDDFEGKASTARIKWLGELVITAQDLMQPGKPGRKGNRVADAIEFLEDFLSDGPRPASAVMAEGKKNGHTPYALKEAKDQLGIVSTKGHFGGDDDDGWSWSLPDSGDHDPDFE